MRNDDEIRFSMFEVDRTWYDQHWYGPARTSVVFTVLRETSVIVMRASRATLRILVQRSLHPGSTPVDSSAAWMCRTIRVLVARE
jgi:hypothetical protein